MHISIKTKSDENILQLYTVELDLNRCSKLYVNSTELCRNYNLTIMIMFPNLNKKAIYKTTFYPYFWYQAQIYKANK
jgi:hypothetical protein